ncbi:DUF2538 family protein [Salinicoccus cyprini]|uniref:DUF2538 family protein n=1 Tax=Salinicoccus cyprini TaxID=2493691 RepID=A0A558AX72_9STAP|nr:DUF2538 family protein [Salinicoccus cyprini]TVT28862.1 DUF2538 family protein [Salinicoccus cyprini]
MRKTYDKETNINEMFDYLDDQIKHSGQPAMEDTYYYQNHEHKEMYLSIRGYFAEALKNPEVDAACYIIAMPDIYRRINIFELTFPMDWIREEERLSQAFKALKPHIQYLALAAAEASGMKFNTKPALSLGLAYWNLEQLKIFWQFTAIRRKNAM